MTHSVGTNLTEHNPLLLTCGEGPDEVAQPHVHALRLLDQQTDGRGHEGLGEVHHLLTGARYRQGSGRDVRFLPSKGLKALSRNSLNAQWVVCREV